MTIQNEVQDITMSGLLLGYMVGAFLMVMYKPKTKLGKTVRKTYLCMFLGGVTFLLLHGIFDFSAKDARLLLLGAMVIVGVAYLWMSVRFERDFPQVDRTVAFLWLRLVGGVILGSYVPKALYWMTIQLDRLDRLGTGKLINGVQQTVRGVEMLIPYGAVLVLITGTLTLASFAVFFAMFAFDIEREEQV